MLRYPVLCLLVSLGLSACEPPTANPVPAAPAAPAAPTPLDRELGTVSAIYPHLTEFGTWLLEYRLSRDTVFVEYEAARAKTADPAWKEALTTGFRTFYDNGTGCMYTRSVEGCLAFRKGPALP